MKKILILVILGPTATGKSDLAVALARQIQKEKIGGYIGAEIISADSRQVYRDMDIGTGKITHKEMNGIPHHLLDVADPRKQFTVVDFKTLADEAIKDISTRNKLPIICGGTGFYIDTLLNDSKLEHVGANVALRNKLSTKSAQQLFKMLEKLNPERARRMNQSDSHNPRRLIRAIEITTASPSRMAAMTSTLQYNYEPFFFGLQLPNEPLRKRIHERLLKRIKAGMIREARRLHKPISKGGAGVSWKRMEELGLEYRYMARHLQGKLSLDEMVRQLETEIWHYAKRQMTWFKRNMRTKWFRLDQICKIEKLIRKII